MRKFVLAFVAGALLIFVYINEYHPEIFRDGLGSKSIDTTATPSTVKQVSEMVQDSTVRQLDSVYYISICDLPGELINDAAINSIIVMPEFMTGMAIKPIISRRLNDKEREYLQRHPINTARGAYCALGAEGRTQGVDGRRGGKADALRHTFWAACMSASLGPEVAQEILDNHENDNGDPMDAFNNKFGVALGQTMKGKSSGEIWEAVLKAYNDGQLYGGRPKETSFKDLPIIPGLREDGLFRPILDLDESLLTPTPIDESVIKKNEAKGHHPAAEPKQNVRSQPSREPRQKDPNEGIANPRDPVPRGGDTKEPTLHSDPPMLGITLRYDSIWTNMLFRYHILSSRPRPK